MFSLSRIPSWLRIILISIFGLCAGLLLLLLGESFIGFITTLKSEVAVAIIAVSGSIIVSVATFTIGKWYESKASVEQENRKQKLPVYEELIDFMFKVIFSNRTGGRFDVNAETKKFMTTFTPKFTVWADDSVVKKWSDFRRLSQNQEVLKENPLKLMEAFEDIIRAIRKDLGHKNKDLGDHVILHGFINDLDTIKLSLKK